MGEKRFYLHTLGCKVNWCDSEEVARVAAARGWRRVRAVGDADVAVVNTCTVTAHADATARKVIRAVRRANPRAPVIVMGCYARTEAEAVGGLVENVRVVKECSAAAAVAEMEEALAACGAGEGQGVRAPVALAGTRTRAFIKVQDGCDQWCAYCKVPLARGTPRSEPLREVLRRVEERVAEGFKEVVLTGVNLALYRDGEVGLAGLLRAVASLGAVPRIRLSSVEATVVDERLLEVFGEFSCVMPHVHMPLQSGSPQVLERMRRVVTRERFLAAARAFYACRPEGVITTDVMVGFPGETVADVAATIEVIEEVVFGKVHVFPFSVRPGTLAARMAGRIAPAEIRRREAQVLVAAGAAARRCRERFVGKPLQVLIEQQRGGWWEGFAQNYLRVRTRRPGLRAGCIVELCVDERETEFVEVC